MKPDDALKKLEEITKLIGDGLTRKEFTEAFDAVSQVILRAREELSILTRHELEQVKRDITSMSGKLSSDTKRQLKDALARLDAALEEQQRGMDFIHDKVRSIAKSPGPAGRDGIDGKDGEPGANGLDGSPDSPEDVRDKLESLEGDERLDASAIKNLPEVVNKLPIAPMTGSFHQLGDVDVHGVVSGQSITWDGIKWVPYTPAGSGGTPVWGEDLTTQGPGTTFTLAHTPITGTVRLFRGGAYQSAQNGDYSITGDTITLSQALVSGEVLVADYSY